MKRYSLSLTVNGTGLVPNSVQTIESDNIIELLALFPRIVALTSGREIAHLKEIVESMKWRLDRDDDIPF